MITVRGLRKAFGPLEVLRGVDCAIAPGRITAIVGPNAAGKTTFMKSLVGLVVPDAGDVRVDGVSVLGSSAWRRRLGFMPQAARFPENLTVAELLAFVRGLRGMPAPHEAELLRLFDVHDVLDRPVRVLSGGTRQKISAVLAFMFDPDLLVLDEPTVGLDPLAGRRFKDRLVRERAHGKTVVLASHVMSDLEEVSDRVVYLVEGRVWFDGTLAEIRLRTGEPTLERAIARLMEREAA